MNKTVIGKKIISLKNFVLIFIDDVLWLMQEPCKKKNSQNFLTSKHYSFGQLKKIREKTLWSIWSRRKLQTLTNRTYHMARQAEILSEIHGFFFISRPSWIYFVTCNPLVPNLNILHILNFLKVYKRKHFKIF